MELMTIAIQTIIKGTLKGNDAKPCNKEGKTMKRDRRTIRKRKKEEEKETPQTDPCIDYMEQLLRESSMFNNYLRI